MKGQQDIRKYIQQEEPKETMNVEEKTQEEAEEEQELFAPNIHRTCSCGSHRGSAPRGLFHCNRSYCNRQRIHDTGTDSQRDQDQDGQEYF